MAAATASMGFDDTVESVIGSPSEAAARPTANSASS